MGGAGERARRRCAQARPAPGDLHRQHHQRLSAGDERRDPYRLHSVQLHSGQVSARRGRRPAVRRRERRGRHGGAVAALHIGDAGRRIRRGEAAHAARPAAIAAAPGETAALARRPLRAQGDRRHADDRAVGQVSRHHAADPVVARGPRGDPARGRRRHGAVVEPVLLVQARRGDELPRRRAARHCGRDALHVEEDLRKPCCRGAEGAR